MPDIPHIRELDSYEFPQARSFRVHYCHSCPNAHVVLFDDQDEPIAQFVIGKLNLQRLITDANVIFDRHDKPPPDNVRPLKR